MLTKKDHFLIQYLMGKDVFIENSSAVEFSYMSNSDGTIRWIYPQQLKKPFFLNFYSTASLRAKVLSSIIKFAYFTKQSHRLKSGDAKLNISKQSRLGKILNEYPNTGFSIFTGTVGENRKAVIEIHNEERILLFVKIALTEAAKVLVNNEAKSFQYLNTFEFQSMILPKLLSTNHKDTISLSNIKPNNSQQNSSLLDMHVLALYELYSITSRKKNWANLSSLDESESKIKCLLDDYNVVNNLDKTKVQKFSTKMLLCIDMLQEKNDELTVSISHGDFTPWNMYSANNLLHLFDWELSQNSTPVLFDLFHFIFQSEVMIKHTGYTEISKELERMLQMKSTQVLIKKFDVNVNKHYIFYLVYNISYYLSKYIKQEKLHEQVFWLIDVWEDAVNDLIDKQGVLFEK